MKVNCKSKCIQFATVSFLSEWNESASRSGKIQLLGLFINYSQNGRLRRPSVWDIFQQTNKRTEYTGQFLANKQTDRQNIYGTILGKQTNGQKFELHKFLYR